VTRRNKLGYTKIAHDGMMQEASEEKSNMIL
jgi:hypothetical protein